MVKYDLLVSMWMPIMPSIPAVTANLLQIATTGEPSNSHSRPSEFGHQFREATTRARLCRALTASAAKHPSRPRCELTL
jgi:hypothetical protein